MPDKYVILKCGHMVDTEFFLLHHHHSGGMSADGWRDRCVWITCSLCRTETLFCERIDGTFYIR